MFGRSKEPKKPEVPEVDEKEALKAKLAEEIASLKDTADALDSEITKLGRALDSIEKDASYEANKRDDLHKKADGVDDASKGRNKALDDKMKNEYARKEKPTPSQKKKAEEIRKKAKEQGI